MVHGHALASSVPSRNRFVLVCLSQHRVGEGRGRAGGEPSGVFWGMRRMIFGCVREGGLGHGAFIGSDLWAMEHF